MKLDYTSNVIPVYEENSKPSTTEDWTWSNECEEQEHSLLEHVVAEAISSKAYISLLGESKSGLQASQSTYNNLYKPDLYNCSSVKY